MGSISKLRFCCDSWFVVEWQISFLVSTFIVKLIPEQIKMASSTLVKDVKILGGVPVFRGTRVPFQSLLDYLEGGHTLDHFLNDFPTVSRESAIAALEEAKALVVAQLE